MDVSIGELYRLASDLADRHGAAAVDYAGRAMVALEAEGAHERAHFWYLMLVMLGDIQAGRIDPHGHISVH